MGDAGGRRGLESLGNKTWWSRVHVQLGRVENSRSMGGGVGLSCYKLCIMVEQVV